nr:hypothetical protein [Tanacetum cinerariifolium]
ISFPFLLRTIGLAVGPTSLLVETIVAWGPTVGMKPLPVGTLASPARTVAASIEVRTLAISSESLLILAVGGMGAVRIDGSRIDEVEGCDDVTSGEGV